MAKSVLLVDDDQSFLKLVGPLLSGRGLAVHEAARLADATKQLALRPDLIIVDGLLPDGSGVDWIKALPAAERQRPILFVSAFWKSLKEHQKLQKELEGVQIVHKPINRDQFAGQVDRLLGQVDLPELPPEVAREMDKLKVEYGRELPGKLEELRRAVRLARASPGDTAARKLARTLAHRLSGTAGSYGFPDESVAAGVAESQAVACDTAPEAARDALWATAEDVVTDALMGRIVTNG